MGEEKPDQPWGEQNSHCSQCAHLGGVNKEIPAKRRGDGWMSAAQEQESERVEYRTNEIDTTWSSGKEFWFLVEGIHESLSQVLIPLSMAKGEGKWCVGGTMARSENANTSGDQGWRCRRFPRERSGLGEEGQP